MSPETLALIERGNHARRNAAEAICQLRETLRTSYERLTSASRVASEAREVDQGLQRLIHFNPGDERP